MIEVNFDGLIGPSHNYAGLSFGNVASAQHAGEESHPRAAALQGIGKMRTLLRLGLPQGFFLPHKRPDLGTLRSLGFSGDDPQVVAAAYREDPALLINCYSASAMWTANAATVSPSVDTGDRRCHFSVANLSSMLHRSIEAVETAQQLRAIFCDPQHFAIHRPVPNALGDEGAANHMRMAATPAAPGIEIFVYGAHQQGGFPARQNLLASQAVARRHGLKHEAVYFAQQSDTALQAGAFHNDVVAVANATILFAHEQAFAEKQALYDFIRQHLPTAEIIEIPAAEISLELAIATYLFNSQLVSLSDGTTALIVPGECAENEIVWGWLQGLLNSNGPINHVAVIDVRESMHNGGGPACLRLRVALTPGEFAKINQRYLLNEARCDALERLVKMHWPEAIKPADLGQPQLWEQCWAARKALVSSIANYDVFAAPVGAA